MTADNLNSILKNPSQLKLSDLSLLTQVIKKHPYFQAPRAISLKCLKEQESYLYNQKLKETAAYTTDRGVLFDFITSKTFNETAAIPITPITEEDIEDIIPEAAPEAETTKEKGQEKLITENKATTKEEITTSKENITALKETTSESIKMTNEEADQIVDPFLFEEKTTVKKTITEQTSKPEKVPNKEKEVDTETTININKPLNFEKTETHSFSEWLKLASLKPIDRSEEKPGLIIRKKLIESSLIDNFIKNNPKIAPVKKETPTINLATQNLIPTEDLMTETLAKVYIAQKNYKKAIQAYKILSLKNPEKSGLFADQIRAIERLQNNK